MELKRLSSFQCISCVRLTFDLGILLLVFECEDNHFYLLAATNLSSTPTTIMLLSTLQSSLLQ